MSLSDRSHYETCARCNYVGDRTEMKRLQGKRSWLCPRHYELHLRVTSRLPPPSLMIETLKALRGDS